ncbi:MAG: hypothetical protein ACRDRO_22350 [Pseudonocardiaceae bacterium]
MSAKPLPLLDPLPGRRRALVRAAFSAFVPKPEVAYRHRQRWSQAPPRIWDGSGGGERLVVVVPTVTRGAVPPALRDGLGRIADAVAMIVGAEPEVRCFVAVALYEATASALARAVTEEIERAWQATGTVVPWVGVTVSEPSKVLALNCTLPLLDVNGATAIAWFDDDVEVMSDCLLALWRAYDPAATCVYGARALPACSGDRSGIVGALLSSRSAVPNAYPYGCSMLLSRATFGAGIPLVYMSDDHYFLLSLLDPRADDPLHRLRVVPDAVVRIGAPRSLRVAVRRVVRNYRNVQRVLADADEVSVRHFRRRLHFAALRPPRSVREALTPGYWIRLGFQAGRALLWQVLVAEVLLRGLLARPRLAVWSSDQGR